MSIRSIVTLITLTVLSNQAHLFAQWQFTGGPEGGAGYGIIKHGDEIFAATFNGVYRSSTMGDTWTPSGLRGKVIFRMLSAGDNIYASVDNVLFQSSDDGMTWQETFTTGGTRVQALVYHKEEIYLSVYQEDGGDQFGGVYRSGDGKTWTRVTIGANSSYVRALLSVDFYLVAVTYADGIFRTNTRGETWTTSTINLAEPPKIWTASADNGRIYAAGDNAVFLTSTNYGSTWQATTANGIREWDTFYDVQRAGNKYYAITINSDTLYLSTDNGVTWQPDLSADLPHNQYGISSKYGVSHIDNRLFCQMDIGTFSTLTSVLDWKYSGTGIVNSNCASLASFDGTIYAGSLGGPHRSTDNGTSWISPEDSARLQWRSVNVRRSPTDLYAYGEEGLWRLGGGSWTQLSGDAIYDFSSQGDTIFWADGYALYYSTNKGATKIKGSQQLPDTLMVDYVFSTGSAVIVNAGFLFEDAQGGFVRVNALFRSDDGMQTWQRSDPNVDVFVEQFIKHGNTLYLATYGSGLYRSTDDGRSWAPVASISPATFVEALHTENDMLFISIYDDALLADGIYYSFDNGATWTFIGKDAGIANGFVSHNGDLYASIYNAGVWKRSLAELDVHTSPVAMMEQPIIYPNPATNSITVRGDATKIIVRSTMGAVVWETAVTQHEPLQLPALAKGIYLAEIVGKGTSYTNLIIE